MNSINYARNKQPEHDRIAAEIAAFQASGGKVEVITEPVRRNVPGIFNSRAQMAIRGDDDEQE